MMLWERYGFWGHSEGIVNSVSLVEFIMECFTGKVILELNLEDKQIDGGRVWSGLKKQHV